MAQKNSLLQIYRGLASALVVIHHISASSVYYVRYPIFGDIFHVGWSGVDFFFVLSGFIITNVHFNDIGNSFKLPTYFLKRFARIYPTYWIIASLSLFLLFVMGKKEINGEALSFVYILKSYMLVPSLYAPFVGVAWSLCFEVFFYVMFALFIWKGFKVLYYLMGIYLIVLYLNFYTIEGNSLLKFLCNGYHIEFVFGCIVAVFSKKVNYSHAKILLYLGVVLFAFTYIMSYLNFLEKISLASRFLFGIASSLIILGSLKVNTRYGYKSLVLLGDASFSLYLVHTLIIPLFFKLFASKQFIHYSTNTFIIYAVSIVCFIICVIISVLYFWYVEKPMTLYFNKKIKDAYPTNP